MTNTRELDGLQFDFSRQTFSEQDLAGLMARLEACDFSGWRDRLFAGDPVNATEGRAALHMALRGQAGEYPVSEEVIAERERCFAFDASRFRDVVNIGIGGSYLGPALVVDALGSTGAQQFHFVANVDGAALSRVLAKCIPSSTLFIVASKTFTTQETLLNARSARAWLVDALGEAAVADHFVAVTAAKDKAVAFGIREDNVFGCWDWVGGRYSLWSAMGLAAMIALGRDRFTELLEGARSVDVHFRDAALSENLPVLMAMVAAWNREQGAASHAVLPYAEALQLLPAYLQQLVMESLGKRVDRDGKPVSSATSPVVWGMTGTNGQHAFHQMLHQGTDRVSVDFIGFREPVEGPAHHHEILLANLFAQAEALWTGRSTGDAHRDCPGGRPSNILLFDRLSPFNLGRLLALYEHQVFVLSVLWNINPFDQFGVELGKEIASRMLRERP